MALLKRVTPPVVAVAPDEPPRAPTADASRTAELERHAAARTACEQRYTVGELSAQGLREAWAQIDHEHTERLRGLAP